MRTPQRDANERAIVEALRAAGHLVQHLQQGDGVPDLLVLAGNAPPAEWHGPRRLVLLEVKDGAKPPSAQKLTADQVRWHQQWFRAPLHIVNSVEQALAAVGNYE
jgi:hypothetical protein